MNQKKEQLIVQQKDLLTKISCLMMDIPIPHQMAIKRKIKSILAEKSNKSTKDYQPEGEKKSMTMVKIINGNVVNVNTSPELVKTESASTSIVTATSTTSSGKKFVKIAPKMNRNKNDSSKKMDPNLMKMKFKLINGMHLIPISKPNGLMQSSCSKSPKSQTTIVKDTKISRPR